jgi:hypothetical protein
MLRWIEALRVGIQLVGAIGIVGLLPTAIAFVGIDPPSALRE